MYGLGCLFYVAIEKINSKPMSTKNEMVANDRSIDLCWNYHIPHIILNEILLYNNSCNCRNHDVLNVIKPKIILQNY